MKQKKLLKKNNINSWLKKKNLLGTSLLVQLLRLHSPNAEGPGSYPGQRTRYATTKTQCSQINNFL